jgi:hypothetical protein
MADDDRDVVAGVAAGPQAGAHQRRADTATLPGREHGHRRQCHDRVRALVAAQRDRVEEDVTDDRLAAGGHEAEVDLRTLAQAFDDTRLVGLAKRHGGHGAHGVGVGGALGSDGECAGHREGFSLATGSVVGFAPVTLGAGILPCAPPSPGTVATGSG